MRGAGFQGSNLLNRTDDGQINLFGIQLQKDSQKLSFNG